MTREPPLGEPGRRGNLLVNKRIVGVPAVVGGLLTSTLLTLFVVPILFTVMNRERTEPEIDLDRELQADEEELQMGIEA